MRLRTIGIALAALLALGVGGGLLAFKAAGALAAADGEGIAQALVGVLRNGLGALGDDDGSRIRSASSAEQEGEAPEIDTPAGVAAEGADSDAPTPMHKRFKMGPGHAEIMIGRAGKMPKGFEVEPGVLVAGVQTDGPAAKAGLSRGDIIVALDGAPIETMADLHAAMAERQVGQVIALGVEHGDEDLTLEVTVGNLEGSAWLGIAPCGGGMHAMPGMGMGPIHLELNGDGARIMGLEPGGPAESAGVVEGEVIKAVDGIEIGPENDLAEVLSGYAPGDTITLTLVQAGETTADGNADSEESGVDADTDGETAERTVAVILGEHPDDPERAFLGVHYTVEIIGGAGEEFEFDMDPGSFEFPEGFELPEGFSFEDLHDMQSEDGGTL